MIQIKIVYMYFSKAVNIFSCFRAVGKANNREIIHNFMSLKKSNKKMKKF